MDQNQIPRRIQIQRMHPAELAIREAMLKVENLGGSTRLTDVINLLQAAKDKVADHIEDVPEHVNGLIGAHTGVSESYPEYVNIYRKNGEVEVTVRGAAVLDSDKGYHVPGPVTSMKMEETYWYGLRQAIIRS